MSHEDSSVVRCSMELYRWREKLCSISRAVNRTTSSNNSFSWGESKMFVQSLVSFSTEKLLTASRSSKISNQVTLIWLKIRNTAWRAFFDCMFATHQLFLQICLTRHPFFEKLSAEYLKHKNPPQPLFAQTPSVQVAMLPFVLIGNCLYSQVLFTFAEFSVQLGVI